MSRLEGCLERLTGSSALKVQPFLRHWTRELQRRGLQLGCSVGGGAFRGLSVVQWLSPAGGSTPTVNESHQANHSLQR